MLREGIIIGERYEIISRVGSGGMADVYKAMDHKLNRLVAVKVLKAEFRGDGGFIAKFRKEAQAAAGLAHPNIVNVYDVGEDRGLYYIVMELVEGITLKNYIDKKGKLSVKEATSIAIQVSLGLECAHNQGIVHRDVKPQNIIISVDGKVKLSDFGIAKAINSNTITANVMGSVHFSSPEQVRGGFADSKSDIYSLGITMYEMVTGRVPFDGDTTVAIAIKHLQEEIIPPSRYTPDLPYSLEQIILKCTQKNPERRYANIGLLIDDLKRSLIDPQGNFVQMSPRDTNSQVIPAAAAAAAAAGAAKTQKVQAKTQTIARNTAAKPKYSNTETYSKYDTKYDDEYDDDYDTRPARSSQKRRSRKDSDAVSSKLEKAITIGGFLIGAIIIIILIIVIGNMSGLFNKKSGTTAQSTSTSASSSSSEEGLTVPNFKGKTLEEAQSIAAQYGLTIRQTGTQESNIYPEGQIMSQTPDSGTKAEANSQIDVVVSSGASKTTVPTGLTGLTQAEAETMLSQVGLKANVQLQDSDTEAGRVVSVNPAEGSEVASGSSVTIYVSKGGSATTTPTASQLPNLEGKDEAAAKSILDSMGINYTIITEESDTVAEGTVISMDPAAGTSVASGATVTLHVSSGASSDEYWVHYEGFGQPMDYKGGTVKIVLEQEGTTSLVYQGENPFGQYDYYTDIVYGKAGVSTGTINIYEYNDSTGEYELLDGSVTIDFKSPYS